MGDIGKRITCAGTQTRKYNEKKKKEEEKEKEGGKEEEEEEEGRKFHRSRVSSLDGERCVKPTVSLVVRGDNCI